MHKLLLVVPLVMSLTSGLQAQEPCRDDETVARCQQRVANRNSQQPSAIDKEELAGAVDQENRRRLTPPDSSGSDAASSMKDFLPFLAVVAQSVSLDTKSQQVVIDFNLPSRISPRNVAIQVQSLIHQPQISELAKSQLDAKQAQALTGTLGDLDDVTLALTIGIQNKHFGRRLADNNDTFVRLFDAAVPDISSNDDRAAQELQGLCTRMRQTLPHRSLPDPTLGDYDLPGRESLRAACTTAAVALGEVQVRRVNALKRVHIEKLADLVNNQPQLVFTLNRRTKDELVGPDETTGQVSWEWSSRDLNRFRSSIEGPTALQGNDLVAAFESFSLGANTASRLKLSVQYIQIEEYALARPAYLLVVNQPRATRWTGSFTYGKPVLLDKNGKEIGRIDAAILYENFSDDPRHKDRGVASFTYTQKLSDTFSFPIGITYANHERFLNDVQRRFSAHFGLKMKLFGNS